MKHGTRCAVLVEESTATEVPADQNLNQTTVRPEKTQRTKRKRQPKYQVVLWDDNDHTYDYVIRMCRELFGHSTETAFAIARSVDKEGRAVCLTTTMEHAELKRDQIHAYGKDVAISHCRGSMSASIVPEPA